MNTILVLTDFSKSAACAAEAGLVLSEKLRTDLLLFNTCVDYATIPSYSGGVWIVDEFSERKNQSKLGLAMLAEGLESLCDQLDPHDRRPGIYWQSEDSDLGLNVAEIIRERAIELVVMGARSETIDDFPTGWDTNSVIKNTTRPILVIPFPTDLKGICKVIFATDFDESDIKAVHFLTKLGKLFNYQIEIIHISGPETHVRTKIIKEEAFKKQIAELKYHGLTYLEVKGEDVVDKLNHIVRDNGCGLLAMLHHQYPFFVRIFKHSQTKKVLSNQKIPLLIFPSKMQ